jgi:hypothetical protein
MSLLLLFTGGPAAPTPPVTQKVGASAEGNAPFGHRKEAREMREHRQALADEDAVVAFLISLLY